MYEICSGNRRSGSGHGRGRGGGHSGGRARYRGRKRCRRGKPREEREKGAQRRVQIHRGRAQSGAIHRRAHGAQRFGEHDTRPNHRRVRLDHQDLPHRRLPKVHHHVRRRCDIQPVRPHLRGDVRRVERIYDLLHQSVVHEEQSRSARGPRRRCPSTTRPWPYWTASERWA